MTTPSGNGGSGRFSRLLKVVVALLVCTAAVAAAWWLAPVAVEHLATDQFEDLEQRTGLGIDTGAVRTDGADGLRIDNFEVTAPDGDRPLVRIDELRATVDLLETIRGRPAVTAAELTGVDVSLRRRADGTTDIDAVRDRLGGSGDAGGRSDASSPPESGLEDVADRLLARFGGEYPDLRIRDVDVELTRAEGAAPWPVRRIATDEFSLVPGESGASFETTLALSAPDNPDLTIPEQIDISGTMRRPVATSTVAVEASPKFEIANLSRFPFTEFSLSSLEIGDDYTVTLSAPAVASRLREESHPLGAADRIQVRFDQWPTSLDDLSIREFAVDSPRIFVEFDARGGSNISDLYSVTRQPSARAVATTARAVGHSVATPEEETDAGGDSASEDTSAGIAPPEPTPGLADRLDALPIREWLMEYVPGRIQIDDFRLVVDDARTHDNLTRPADHFEITGERLALEHSPVDGLLEGDLRLETRTEDETGEADIQFEIPYRTGKWNASVHVEDVQLAHFAQLGGPTVARHLHGGDVSARLDVEHHQSRTRFDGLLVGKQMRGYLEAIALEPVEIPSASLQFDGFYDDSMEPPTPDLLDVPDDEGEQSDGDEEGGDEEGGDEEGGDEEGGDEPSGEGDEPTPPSAGALVIEEATARLDDVEAELGIGVYGLDGLRRPARLDVEIGLDRTELQTIVEVVPPAIRGPLDGLRMHGTLAWDFQLEVPLYEASDMVWDSRVDLSDDLEVLYIPEEVDVFGMTEEFEHTIEDEWSEEVQYRERDFHYERTVTIPEMKPTPADWLVENTGLDLEQIDENRRRREWPEIPDWDPSLGIDRQTLESPEYWLTDRALEQSAEIPWTENDGDASFDLFSGWSNDGADDGDEELVWEEPEPPEPYQTRIDIDPDRHGEYVYVPLHHISPYMVRAIQTTEDNSFFTHSGFNYLAIRDSVEQNLEAGRYVRGASTISMQLAKNLFLNRDRVLARKLREITLVWLMESVADIPKARMMEIYLNIIEYGPGIYGIHEAAMHYFGKRPDKLTVDEVAWLVSIVPNPKEYHRYYEQGEINAYWFRRMNRYIRAMEARDRISEDELDDATEQAPSFHIPEDGDALLREDVEPIDPDEITTDEGEEDDGDKEDQIELLPAFD